MKAALVKAMEIAVRTVCERATLELGARCSRVASAAIAMGIP
jgi:hypothetical protein